jgi:hypothetical protein
MKLKSFLPGLIILLSYYSHSQCYNLIGDFSGVDNSVNQSLLETEACKLRDSFPTVFQNQFGVFDFGEYMISEYTKGGFNETWNKIRQEVSSQKKYYLLFGKLTSQNGVYSQFYVDIVLPRDNIFSCMDDVSPNLRENIRKKYEAIANELNESFGKSPSQYYNVEIEVMKQLGNYIGSLKECCDYQNRNSTSCHHAY